jgi:methionyl-tRNA formyltransferase
MTYRIVYFGTPTYAVPALEALHGDSRFEIVLAVTQPDRPAGRGHKLVSPAVKTAAEALAIPVYQPQSLRTPETRQPLIDARPDLFVVAAFGLIFGEKTLAIPRFGSVNLHASILPAYRGANPIAAAIACGEYETGISLMIMERGLDSGPVIAARSIAIEPDDTTETLTRKLAVVGASLALDEIEPYLTGEKRGLVQPSVGVTLARPMRKSDGEIDWSVGAVVMDRHVRAMWPWPRAWSKLGDQIVQIHSIARVFPHENRGAGEISIEAGVRVGCATGSVELGLVQLPGKSPTNAAHVFRATDSSAMPAFMPLTAPREPLVTTLNDGSATTS